MTLASALSSEDQKALQACASLVSEEWEHTVQRIPIDLESSARATKALQRKREVQSASDLLRLVLAYSVCDWSARLVGLWATVLGVASLSDVAVRKRLRQSRAWLGYLISTWLHLRRGALPDLPIRVLLTDATSVRQPGSTTTDWRVHVGFDLGQFCLDEVVITDAHGGETLARQTLTDGVILVGDRGYAHRKGVGMVLAAGGQVVVRLNWKNLPVESIEGHPFDVGAWLQAEVTATQPSEISVWVSTPEGRFEMRLVAQRLPAELAEAARRRVRKAARKKGHTPSATSLWNAEFIVLLTSLLSGWDWPATALLALYRLRWQIELLFKRWKSVLHLEHLRTQDSELAQVYLFGKLLGALLVEAATHNLAPGCADWFIDLERPVSPWRWTLVRVDLLRQAIQGTVTAARFQALLPQLTRYLCESPRKRRQQLVYARCWLQQLGLPAGAFSHILRKELLPA